MISLTTHVAKEQFCGRADCEGWLGTVTYITGDHRTPLPVIDGCQALKAFTIDGAHEVCPLTQPVDGQQ